MAYGKDNYDLVGTLDNDGEIKSHFETFKGFVDDYVLDLRRRDKGCDG